MDDIAKDSLECSSSSQLTCIRNWDRKRNENKKLSGRGTERQKMWEIDLQKHRSDRKGGKAYRIFFFSTTMYSWKSSEMWDERQIGFCSQLQITVTSSLLKTHPESFTHGQSGLPRGSTGGRQPIIRAHWLITCDTGVLTGSWEINNRRSWMYPGRKSLRLVYCSSSVLLTLGHCSKLSEFFTKKTHQKTPATCQIDIVNLFCFVLKVEQKFRLKV